MSIKKSLFSFTFCFLILAGVFFVLPDVRAYDSQNDHSFLTNQITELYNKIYEPDLTKSQIEQLMKGSSDEDITPRWINHFYDPILNKEWLGKRLQGIPEEQVRQISKIAFGKDPVSIMNWAHNQDLQTANYRLYQGNRTFESAVLFYLDNEKDNAYYNLGYILHLLEDMTVPAHTRQDSHFDVPVPELFEKITGITFDNGEPYENWAKNYISQNKDTSLVDKLKNNYQQICNSLDNCLNVLALYSNNNFFSQDTIFDKEYQLPNIKYKNDKKNNEKSDMIERTYFSEQDIPTARAKISISNEKIENISLDYSDINQAYWDELAPKAILAGVEVIKYFQEEVERAKNEEIIIEKAKKPSFLDLLKGISPWGELEKAGRFIESVKQEFYDKLKEAWDEFNLSIKDFYNRLSSFNPFLAFTPPTFSIEETIFSEKIEPPPDPFAEEDSGDKTDEIITGIVEYMTGVGGPDINLDFQDQQDAQEALDDIIEKLDILRQQALEFIEEHDADNNEELQDQEQEEQNDEQNNDQNTENNENDDQTEQQSNPPATPVPPTIGGGAKPVYLKILISEVQVTGLTNQKEEFVELYNPNSTEINLTDWYLQKKTKTGTSFSTYAPNTVFSGKKIGGNSYFLIARENSSFTNSADIIIDNSLAEDNSLILKNPNGEISDKLGFGEAQEYETNPAQNPEKGQSIGRKWDVTNNIEQDTDNNLTDFEAQNSTPKTKNSVYTTSVNPPLPPTPTDTTAPEVIFNLDAIQTSLTFSINFDITDPMTTVSSSGIDSYVFRWQTEGGSWQEDPEQKILEGPSFQNFTREFEGQDETIYYFQIKAKDIAGNESDWQPETPAETKISIPKKVLINEIQIAGLTDEKQEFVELYNPSVMDIDLTGWYLQKKTKTAESFSTFAPNTLFSGKKIKSKGYFLIAREESSFAEISDIVTSHPLTEDNTLAIKNSNEDIIDKVGWGEASDFETEPAETPPAGQSIGRKWDLINIVFQDTDNNLADFEAQTLSPKPSSPKVFIEDATDYLNSLFDTSGNIWYYTLKIKWNSPALNLDFYDIQYKINDGNWQDWALQTIETEKTYDAYYSMFTDYVYYFRVRAQDKEGNQGDWVEVTVDVTNPVVINEVALFGTDTSKDDQMIELYNRTDKEIDLTGWKIGLHNGLSQTLSGIIPANGYLVLSSIDASLMGSLESRFIYLLNQKNRQIDKFYTPNGLGKWNWLESDFMKGENYYSMERISPYAFGNYGMNWRINNSGDSIYETFGRQNSNYQIYTPLTSDFIEDTTLPLQRSPYLVHSSLLSIRNDKILTIEPGVIMKFYDSYGLAGLEINGILRAIGTSDTPIVFTSYFDDQYGGDIDGDAEQINLVPGNWVGLQFEKDAGLSELDNVIVRYAGSSYGNLGRTGIRADQVAVSLKNSTVEKNLKTGLLLINSSSVIDNVNFLDHEIVPGYEPYGGEGIYVQGGNPQIVNSYFKGNNYGVFIDNWIDSNNILFLANASFLNNNFLGNILADIWDVNNPPEPPAPPEAPVSSEVPESPEP